MKMAFRKNLYVWDMKDGELLKNLDAHFGRIIKIQSLTIGNWNSVITSSIDRTVKVWNINNIFEQVHVIDRHELQIDAIRLMNKFDDNDKTFVWGTLRLVIISYQKN